MPDGVFNIIHTSREEAGARVAEIIAHPLVRKVGVSTTSFLSFLSLIRGIE